MSESEGESEGEEGESEGEQTAPGRLGGHLRDATISHRLARVVQGTSGLIGAAAPLPKS